MTHQERMPLADMQSTLLGRSKLDEKNIERLMEALKNGTELKITLFENSNGVFNGGHTLEAYRRLGRADAPIERHRSRGTINDLADALKTNAGGSLPPTRDDFLATIRRMFNEGEKQEAIVKKLASLKLLPAASARSYCKIVKRMMNQTRMQQAVSAVAEEKMGVADAARHFKVKLPALKNRLSGKKKRHSDADQFTDSITALSRSSSQKRKHLYREIDDAVSDGTLDIEGALTLHQQVVKLAQRGLTTAYDAQTAFEKANSLPVSHRAPRKDRGKKRSKRRKARKSK